MAHYTKHFTLQEALQEIPELKQRFERILQILAELASRQVEVAGMVDDPCVGIEAYSMRRRVCLSRLGPMAERQNRGVSFSRNLIKLMPRLLWAIW